MEKRLKTLNSLIGSIDVKGKGAMKTYFFDDGTPLDPAVFSKPAAPDRTSRVLYGDNSDTQGQFFGIRM